MFDSEAAAGAAQGSSAGEPPHRPQSEAEEALEQALAQIEQLRAALAELEARTPSVTTLERMVDRAVRSSNGAARSAPGRNPVHHLFYPTSKGYRIETRDGPPPAVGSTVEIDGGRFDVTHEGPSPLPGDDRRCAYVLAR